MILFITGPSGIGKTDCCFSLLMKNLHSVYLDSDWFSAKTPIDPLSAERIHELYDLLKLNVLYHKDKGITLFFIALYQEASKFLPNYIDRFAELDLPTVTVLLTANRIALEKRILSRDRVPYQKKQEVDKIDLELAEAAGITRNQQADIIIDTSDMQSDEIAAEIMKQCDMVPKQSERT